IAGFETPQKGSIAINGKVLSDKTTNIAPEKRRIGMVFQDYALFPHFTIQQNIAYGLSKKQRMGSDDRIDRLLKLVDLSGFNQRYPHELSGGQQQRVALARALAPEPELILLDEPFSNLDADLRTRLGIQVREILKSLEISAILVTHDQQEAFAMADHIGLINQGSITQWGTPYDLYHEPSSRFVAQFIGRGSFLKGISETHERFTTEIGPIEGNRCYAWPEGTPVDILLRPDDVMYSEHSQTT
ncbi:iron ABC transporter ATP-binding protein, partial [Oleiphilus sp. HI0071]